MTRCNDDPAPVRTKAKVTYTSCNCIADKLAANDTLHLRFITVGCFHSYEEELKMYYRGDSLRLSLNVIENDSTFPPLIASLDDSMLIAYGKFEQAGKSLVTNNLCTTRQDYLITLRTDTIKFADGDCDFDGYELLKGKIFSKKALDVYYNRVFNRRKE
jgi:hypothetical protein